MEGPLDLAVRSFGYVKTTINVHIAIDSRLMEVAHAHPNFKMIIPDFIRDYPDAKEELDPGFSCSLWPRHRNHIPGGL